MNEKHIQNTHNNNSVNERKKKKSQTERENFRNKLNKELL